MSNYRSFKREALRGLVRNGSYPRDLAGVIPSAVLSAWTKGLLAEPKLAVNLKNPRLVNHFSVGADPELVFARERRGEEELLSAHAYGLMSALAFGADNNGRLVEFRPEPSRFCLEVVASLFTEMQWMAHDVRRFAKYKWRAGAWNGQDGMGGHVHFGRKRSFLRDHEVKALDNLTEALARCQFFPGAEMGLRIAHTSYGKPGDFRPQRHGYEYRTMPSWIGTPWQAYLTLVLSKLAVFDTELLSNRSGPLEQAPEDFISGFLSYYKDRDDDARIALAGLKLYGCGRVFCHDIRKAWGVGISEPGLLDIIGEEAEANALLYPTSIAATPAVVEMLFKHFTLGSTIAPLGDFTPTWAHSKVPKGFQALQHYVKTYRSPGIGEACWDLLAPTAYPLYLSYGAGETPGIAISSNAWVMLGSQRLVELRKRFPEVQFYRRSSPASWELNIHKRFLQPTKLPRLRDLLTCGLLPLYKFGEHEKFKPEEWSERPERKQRSQTLFPV